MKTNGSQIHMRMYTFLSKALRYCFIIILTLLSVAALIPLSGFVRSFASTSGPVSAPAAPAGGVLIYVNSTGDGGNLVGAPNCDADLTTPGEQCTLRAAIQVANLSPGEDGIEFAIPSTEPFCNPLGNCVINLSRELPALSTNMQIFGPGAEFLTVRRDIGSGYRIFTVTATGSVSLSGMTISNGSASGDGGALENVNTGTVQITACLIKDNFGNDAGGISNSSGGTININDSTLTGNRSDVTGAIYNKSTGTININNSTITANTSNRFGGGGLFSQGGIVNITGSVISNNRSQARGGGGIKNSGGTISITSSTINNNFDENDEGGGIYNQSGTVNLDRSTLIGNTADKDGAGIYNGIGATVLITNSSLIGNVARPSDQGGSGGGIYNLGTLTVKNSTFSGNTGASGGGIYNFGSATVTNSTISNNTTFGARFNDGDGAGIENRSTQPLLIKSSLIANNTSPGTHPDVAGPFISFGFNLIGKVDGGVGLNATTDQTGTVAAPLDPKLNPAGLQNNGGPTKTIALLCGSPAIDKGGAALGGNLTTDQRGAGFLRIVDDPAIPNNAGGDGSDVGAYELQQICSVPVPIIAGASAILINESCPPANGAIDPGERVTVHLQLTNTGNAGTSNLVATLQSSGGVVSPGDSQSYGVVAQGATAGRDFSLTADPTLICGGTLTATLHLQDGTTDLGLVTFSFTIGVNNGGTFVCTSPCGGVRLVVKSTLSRTSSTTVQASITVENIGTLPANTTMLTAARLGSSDGVPLPQSLGSIAPGGSSSAVVNFNNSTGGASTLTIGGTYDGGSFNSSRRVTVP